MTGSICLSAQIAAHRALSVPLRLDALPVHVLRIEHHQLAAKAAAHAAQYLERFSGLHAAHDAYQRGQHAHGGAAGLFEILCRWKNARIAGGVGMLGVVHRYLAIQSQSRSRYQWFCVANASQVDGMSRLEIVCAVENHISMRY